MNESIESLLSQLQIDLSNPLPGRAAQYRMAPSPRTTDDLYYDTPRPDARQGGVLILLYPHQDRLYIPLILRPTYEGVHSGQIGLPGGGYEISDSDLTATALREAYEEIGIQVDSVTLLGQLSPLYVFASNYLVQPTVAWTPQRPEFKLDAHEVEMLLEVPLLDLLDTNNYQRETWELRGRMVQVPFFCIQAQKIWGATAMILSELLALPALLHVSGR